LELLKRIIFLIAINIIIIWLWIYLLDPDPSMSIGILILIPIVFIINLAISGVSYLLKKKQISKLFLYNSIIASIIMFYLFGNGIDRHQNKRLENWEFKIADSSFSLIRWKETNNFEMNYSLNSGSSWSYIDGKCKLINNEWFFLMDSLEFKINNDHLINFRKDTIKIKKIKR
jgi:hypothetical protein